jgi:membrane protease YdiL (CAAX protease family)
MLEQPAPSALSASRLSAPFGLPEALGAIAISASVYIIPGVILLSIPYLAHHKLTGELAAYVCLSLGVAISAVLLVVMRFPQRERALGYTFPGWSVLGSAALTIVPIYAGIGLIYFVFAHVFPGFHLQGNAKEALPVGQKVGVLKTILLLAFAGVLVPFTEETLFRGILFQGVTRFFSRWMVQDLAVFIGALLSGTIFGLAHGTLHTLPILIFVGVCLAYVFYYARSIYASIIVHGLFNSLAVIALVASS